MQQNITAQTFDTTWANRFHTVLDSIIPATGGKGAALAVWVPGQGLFTEVCGISYPGHPITREMRFGIGSNTKLFIAATITKLQEQGVLSLDDHLYQWLPTFPNIDSTTTIRQLLSHQSGIFDYVSNDFLVGLMMNDTSHFWTPQEILPYVGDPYFAPGKGYNYSNTNYLLAGMIIEVATGVSWVQNLHDFIFDPLVMDSTFVGAFEPRNGPVAAEWISSSFVVINSPMTSEFSIANAAGAILSTAQEMAGWYNSLFSGTVVSDSSLQLITDFEPTSSYGLGLDEGSYNKHLNYHHFGGTLGYMSYTYYDVQTKSVLCLLMNDNLSSMTSRLYPLLDVLYDDFPKKQNDAGISKIVTPWENSCNTTVIPSVVLSNFGSAPLTSAQINSRIDNGSPVSVSWTGTLGPGDTINVALPQMTTDEGFHAFTCYTSHPNGSQEGYTFNDTTKSNFIVNSLPSLISELYEGFDSDIFPPAGWAKSSSSTSSPFLHWGQTQLARYSGSGSAVKANYIDFNTGAFYDLDLPLIHVAAGTHPIIEFKYAYALYPGFFGDSLQVSISTDCGTTWQNVYNKGGIELQTAPSTVYPFYPQSPAEWKQESVSLAADTGDVLIRFRIVCGYSNNLYLDDVNVHFPVGTVAYNSPEPFSIYPNPASYEIKIFGVPVNTEIMISNLTGQLLLTQKTMNTHTKINIEKLSKGVYILRSTIGVKKFVKI